MITFNFCENKLTVFASVLCSRRSHHVQNKDQIMWRVFCSFFEHLCYSSINQKAVATEPPVDILIWNLIDRLF